jgi:hypothetical protein
MSVFITMTLKSGKESRHWHSGQGIGQFAEAEDLNGVAEAAGAKPLLAYLFEHDEFLYVETLDGCPPEFARRIADTLCVVQKQAHWHEPCEGLKTVSALVDHYRKKQDFEGADVVLEDLEAYMRVLAEAEQDGDKFRLEISA